MRRLLILVMLFTVASLYAKDFPLVGSTGKTPPAFKHGQHTDLDCAHCHSGVANSVAGTDNLLPTWNACSECHSEADVANKGIALGEQKDGFVFKYIADYSPIFRHKRHLENAKLECAACHTNLDEAVNHFPRMADCMKCHSERAVAMECNTCHLPGERLKPENHNVLWVQRHGGASMDLNANCTMCHASGSDLDCQSCHQGDAVINPHPRNFLNSHGQDAHLSDMRCGTCHEQRSFCLDCHRDMNVLPNDHFRPGFVTPNGGTHGESAEFDLESCMSCHDTPNSEPTCARCHAK